MIVIQTEKAKHDKEKKSNKQNKATTNNKVYAVVNTSENNERYSSISRTKVCHPCYLCWVSNFKIFCCLFFFKIKQSHNTV